MEKNIIHHNIELKSFNSWRVGGVAENFYICADKQILSNNIKKQTKTDSPVSLSITKALMTSFKFHL